MEMAINHNRAIDKDIHDLVHMMSRAKQWFDAMDKILQDILVRQEQRRKDDV